MTNPHNRTKPRYMPRFPRLQWLLKKRRIDKELEWITVPAADDLVRIVPVHPSGS